MAAVVSTAAGAAAKAPVWEFVQSQPDTEMTPQPQGKIEVSVADGCVYIAADSKVTVEVFTILGQLVTKATVQPGLTRLTLGQRGIYILKGAGTTKRINI